MFDMAHQCRSVDVPRGSRIHPSRSRFLPTLLPFRVHLLQHAHRRGIRLVRGHTVVSPTDTQVHVHAQCHTTCNLQPCSPHLATRQTCIYTHVHARPSHAPVRPASTHRTGRSHRPRWQARRIHPACLPYVSAPSPRCVLPLGVYLCAVPTDE